MFALNSTSQRPTYFFFVESRKAEQSVEEAEPGKVVGWEGDQ